MLRNVKGNLNKFAQELRISEVIAKLLINRGIIDIEKGYQYINSSAELMYNPLLMKDMEKGVQLIIDGIKNKKKILIVGDYDVDGVISTYILYSSLLKCGADVKYHIPDRVVEGYGINESIIRKAKEEDIELIITCDNGIAAAEQIALAKELGMKIVLTDHHDIPFRIDEEGEKEFIIPEADAVINPKQSECKYPFKYLCGGGVALKLVQILFNYMGIDKKESDKYFEYAAIATVCDVVDLVDENRIIVKKGLQMLNCTNNLGIKALIEKTGLLDKSINCYAIGYVIGPCINATGRLLLAELSLKLLLTNNAEEANELAKQLHDLNKERQDMTSSGVEAAVDIIENSGIKNDKILVVYLPEVHESIAGIIAGRIREKYNLPTIILTKGQEGVKGSGRSIEEYNMFEGLTECKDILTRFGGHPMAAGVSIEEENIKVFRERLNSNCKLTEEDLIPKVQIDMQLPFDKISMELAEELKIMEPFGKGNSKPFFAEKNIRVVKAVILGANKNVLKMKMMTKNGIAAEGIYFGDIENFNQLVAEKFGDSELKKMYDGIANRVQLDLIFSITINEYKGFKSVQLNISNYRISV